MKGTLYTLIAVALFVGGWVLGSQQPEEDPGNGLYRIDTGINPPYWLEMHQHGEWTRMALVFGWFEDREICDEWADWQREEYYEVDGRDYRCTGAD